MLIRQKKRFCLILFFIISGSKISFSQSTFNQIYQIINSATCGNNFNSCHNGSGPSGLNFNQTEQQVYAALFNQTPQNNTSASRKDKLIYPGHPYRSFLFRKINNGLAYNVDLVSGEGVSMPQSSPALNEKQIELIRQWIIYGAPATGIVADTSLIRQFYDNSGISTVANPPIAPNPSEGFQLHLGPKFLAPNTENLSLGTSPFNRFDVPLDDSVEIYRIECFVGDGFHHLGFMLLPDSSYNDQIPYGPVPAIDVFPIFDFDQLEIMSTFMHSEDMRLPNGTAYSFPENSPVFIGEHYFNYSMTKVLSCDVYLNVYYQPQNTALHIMKHQPYNYSDNQNNPPLMIPPDGLPHTFTENIVETINPETRFVWAMMVHSHSHTLSYDIFLRNSNGTVGQQVYEVGCPEAIPGCPTPVYESTHIPTRYFDNFLPLNTGNGLYREVTYLNDSPDTLYAGMYAETDEMLGMAYFYISDTTGLGILDGISENKNGNNKQITVYPNPFNQTTTIDWSEWNNLSPVTISVFDVTGNLVYKSSNLLTKNIALSKNNLPSSGMYLFMVQSPDITLTGKFILQK